MRTQGAGFPLWKIWNAPILLVISGAATSLYFSTFRFPLTPIWAQVDQFAFVVLAGRLWEGQILYRDFFYVTPPGHEVVYLLFFRLFGLRNWIPDVDLVLVGLVLTWLIAYIGRKVIRTGRFLPLLPALLFLAYGFARVVRQQDSHRWSSSAALLAAMAVVIEERTLRRIVIAGGLCGIASFFTQTQGVFAVAGLAVFLFWEGHIKKLGWRRRSLQMLWLGASFVFTVLATNAYFVWKAGLRAFLFWTVRFPAIYFPRDPIGGSFHAYLSEIPHGVPMVPLLHAFGPYLFIYALVPFIYVVLLVWYGLRGAANEEGLRVLLVNIIGLCSFAGVAMSPAYLRLCTVSAPALILLVYFLPGKQVLQRAAVAFLWIASLFSLVHRPIMIQRSPMSVLQLPRGPIAFLDDDRADYQMLDWLSAQTRPGDIFFSVNQAGIFYPLALRPMDKSTTGYEDTGVTRSEDVQNAIATLDQYHVRLIQWPPCKSASRFYDPKEDHLGPLRNYVETHYRLAKRFESTDCGEQEEIWTRND